MKRAIVVIGVMGLMSPAVWAQRLSTGSDQTLTMELLRRVEQLEKEMRAIRGELEVQRHQLEERADRTASSEKPADPALQEDTLSQKTEQTVFDQAMQHGREGRTLEAITAWQQFLNAYPQSAQLAEARYGLGEALYGAKDFEAAKEAFIQLGIQHPQSPKIPDALLRLSDIYQALGQAAREREVLNKLIEIYPKSSAAKLAQTRLQTLH